MQLGADQNYIINNLNKNKSITTLNLWGRILARLKQDTHYKLAWSLISQTDFQKSGGSIEDLEGVVYELLSRSPQIKTTILLYETPAGTINGEIYTSPNYNALELSSPWQGTGSRNKAHFQLSENKLISAEQLVVNQIRELIRPLH
jgi:nanoRNase/pAp phosphatase (c-di-AMP/oligoRNAs hydrolase)